MASNLRTREWQKAHGHRMRMHKLTWYYKHRTIILLSRSRPTGIEDDALDKCNKDISANGNLRYI